MAGVVQGKDPNSTTTAGGYHEVAVVDLGNGSAALLTIVATRNASVVQGTNASQQLLAANAARIAATIVNTDPAKNLYLGLNGAAPVVGTNTVAPNASFTVPANAVAGQTNGLWDAGVTGTASIMETTA